MGLGERDRADELGGDEPWTEEHDFGSLLGRFGRAVADVVNDVRRTPIEIANGRHVVVGHNPLLAIDVFGNEGCDLRVVLWLVEVVVEIAALHVVGRVNVDERFLEPLGCASFEELERILPGEFNAMAHTRDCFYALYELGGVIAGVDLPRSGLVSAADNPAV